MAMAAPVTEMNCPQCAAPLKVEQGLQFVTCAFCGATTYLDKARLVFHYLVRPTVQRDAAQAALQRWMAGNATVKDLDRKAKLETIEYQYFPMWLVRTKRDAQEGVFLKPAAALSVSELAQIALPTADLVPYAAPGADRVVDPTVPYETMQQWLRDDHQISPEMITEAALVHLPIYVCKYQFGGKRYTAIVDGATSRVFANLFPAKWEIPYMGLGCACFLAFFVLALLSLFVNFTWFIIGAPVLGVIFFVAAVAVSARV